MAQTGHTSVGGMAERGSELWVARTRASVCLPRFRAVSLAGGAELEFEMDVVADSESSWDHIICLRVRSLVVPTSTEFLR